MSSGLERRTLEELARCAKEGDRICAEQLFRAIGPFVASAAARREFNAEDAKDLAQEVAVRVAVGLKTYDPTLPFKPWLFTILRNANREVVERKQRMRTRQEKLEGEAAIDGGVRPSAGIHLSEFLMALRRCISRIDSEVRREIAWMHLVDKLSEADLEREFPHEGSLRRHLKHDLRALHRCIYPDVKPYGRSAS